MNRRRLMAAMSDRSTVTLLDQVASSASNALIVLAVAGVSSPAQVGAFAVAYAVVAMLITIQRSMFAVQVSLHAADQEAVRREMGHALASLMVLAPVSIAAVLVGNWLAGSAAEGLVVALALGAPIALCQDLLRFSGVAAGRPGLSLASDSAWLAVSVGALAWRFVGDPQSWQVVAVWVLGAVVALAILMVALRARPLFTRLRGWLVESWVERAHLSVGAVATSASVALTALLISRLAGPEVYAALAGAGQLLAPVNVLIAYLAIAVVPHAMRRPEADRPRVFRIAAIRIGLVGVACGLVLAALPERLGSALLGDTWLSTQPVLPVMGLQFALVAVYTAAGGLLTTLGRTRQVMVLGLSLSVTRVAVSTLVAATVSTIAGQAWAGTLVALAGAIGYWAAASRRPRPDVRSGTDVR